MSHYKSLEPSKASRWHVSKGHARTVSSGGRAMFGPFDAEQADDRERHVPP